MAEMEITRISPVSSAAGTGLTKDSAGLQLAFLEQKASERLTRMCARILLILLMPFVLSAYAADTPAQLNPALDQFFHADIGLTTDQIVAIQKGHPVVKALQPRTSEETLLFGAVYIHAAPESYFQYARNFDRLRAVPGVQAVGIFTDPPQISDLQGFASDSEDIQALRQCQPGSCRIQVPATSIDEVHRAVQWSAGDVDQQVNRLLQRTAFQLVVSYQREGNRALGSYNDRPDPTQLPEQFAFLLSHHQALSEYEPDFYHYLLDYPHGKPASYEETIYREKVNFGLKPTLRIVHMISMRGGAVDPVANAVARKQLCSSHYFQTALDLSVCVRESSNLNRTGFCLIQALGSEQAGLSGAKGSIVRRVAVGRALSNLQQALANIKETLESGQPTDIPERGRSAP